MCIEFKLRDIPFVQQTRFTLLYKEHKVGKSVPDLIAYDNVIVDAKTIERITDHECGRMINYLHIAKLPVGLLLNFKRAKLEWRRVILTDH